MSPAPGADHPAAQEEPSLQDAAAGFFSAVSRFLRAFTGLLGLELRETGAHALILGLLAVALIVVCVFAYLFLLLGVTLLVVGWLGGGWVPALLALACCMLLVFFALRLVARRPIPPERRAMRREMKSFPIPKREDFLREWLSRAVKFGQCPGRRRQQNQPAGRVAAIGSGGCPASFAGTRSPDGCAAPHVRNRGCVRAGKHRPAAPCSGCPCC